MRNFSCLKQNKLAQFSKMKLLLFAFLPLLTQAMFHKTCLDDEGNPTSTKPFPIPSNCEEFYQCSNGYLSTQSCAPGTVFNPALSVCDHPSNVPDCQMYTAIACENKGIAAICPPMLTIVVKDGFYGRDDRQTCPHRSIRTTNCAAEKSLGILKESCNGRNTCNLQPTNAVFGDPCVGTYKYIEMNYYCKNNSDSESSKWVEKVICEHRTQRINCPRGSVIWVHNGFYGRDDRTTCPHRSIRTTQCAADGSGREIQSNCNGKNSCAVTATNGIFGDPCVGTFKYIRMQYVCRPSVWQTVTICERNRRTLACGGNQTIALRSGYYGRSNRLTCRHSSIRTTSCSANGSFSTLKLMCDGKSSCTIAANNRVFGDPCVGTYKYVELSYSCN